MEALGLEATEIDVGWWAESFKIFAPIQAWEAARIHAGYFDKFEPAIRERLQWGAKITSEEIASLRQRHAEFRDRIDELIAKHQLLLMPAAPVSRLATGVDHSQTRAAPAPLHNSLQPCGISRGHDSVCDGRNAIGGPTRMGRVFTRAYCRAGRSEKSNRLASSSVMASYPRMFRRPNRSAMACELICKFPIYIFLGGGGTPASLWPEIGPHTTIPRPTIIVRQGEIIFCKNGEEIFWIANQVRARQKMDSDQSQRPFIGTQGKVV